MRPSLEHVNSQREVFIMGENTAIAIGGTGFRLFDPTTLERLQESNLILVDVRREIDYDQGHIPGSINIPVSSFVIIDGKSKRHPSSEELSKILSEGGISNKNTVVAYDDQNGAYSSRFLWTMELYGHKSLGLLDQNFEEYARRGGRISKERAKTQPADYQPKFDESKLATWEYVKSHLEDNDTTIVDTRNRPEFLSGHMPGVVSFYWILAVGKDKIFQDQSRLEMIFDEHFLNKNKEIITYCKDGMTSSHTYLALKLMGFSKIRLYTKGYNEWKNLPDISEIAELPDP